MSRKTKKTLDKVRKLNWNTKVKVKLTDYGKDIYFHQYDCLIEKGLKFAREYPPVDDEGFTKFQLWSFMSIYGSHIGIGLPKIVEDLNFYIQDSEMGWEENDDSNR